ncbi:unnamed protein product [Thelazia callipaeda]|uniref:Protein kinase domain-containing protein n=1 Tax=Thelazia callipaeda TaxID=103827 RepID=A0A0N5D844_THECL|nr:unnamed protein product [Thelazia callipaeda]
MLCNTVISQNGVRYKLKKIIARGGFGVVFQSENSEGNKVAIKMQSCHSSMPEMEVLKALNNCIHFCKFYDEGMDVTTHFIVMELVGPSLVQLKKQLPDKKFTLSTAIRVSMQCLHAIEELHQVGFISRDIKPDNFTIGLAGPKQRLIRMIDFGTAKKMEINVEDEKLERVISWVGTARYCSIANHKKIVKHF